MRSATASRFRRISSRRSAHSLERKMPDAFQACVRTPFATLGIEATDKHVIGIRFLAPSVPALMPKRNSIAHLACVQLQAYLEDPQFAFDLPLRFSGTRHRVAVWEAMQRIPAGRTQT